MSALEQAQLDDKLGTSHTKAGRSGALRAKLGILFCGRSVGGESKCYRSGRELNIDPRNGRIELAVFGVTPMEMGVPLSPALRGRQGGVSALHSATAAKGRRLLN
jgi:hypothetical protein